VIPARAFGSAGITLGAPVHGLVPPLFLLVVAGRDPATQTVPAAGAPLDQRITTDDDKRAGDPPAQPMRLFPRKRKKALNTGPMRREDSLFARLSAIARATARRARSPLRAPFVSWSLRGSPLRFLCGSVAKNPFSMGLFRSSFNFHDRLGHNFAPLSGAGGTVSSGPVRLRQARIRGHTGKYGFCGATVYSRLTSNRANIW
jgi:hypothetical protein